MNILYIGSSGALSLTPFKKLLHSAHNITAVAVDRPLVFNDKLIALQNESLALAASQQAIPVIDLSQPVDSIIAQLGAIDVILMSCYGRRLPDEIIKLAPMGCFNLHPSLLPKYRGPEPVFWQMKAGATLGVSWHVVSQDFDAGDIVAQKAVCLADGLSYAGITAALAEQGAALLLPLLTAVSEASLKRSVQPPAQASYQSYPVADDFVIDNHCSARQAYNFMRATAVFGQAYRCQRGLFCYLLDKALVFDETNSLKNVEVAGDKLYIPCNEGVLTASFTAKLSL